MIKGRGLNKSYDSLQVLKNIDIDINQGEVVSIVGPSGAGKTTLLQILGSLDEPDSGTVEIDGVNLSSLSEKGIAQFRNTNIGFVFQFHHLLPEFNAIENILMPALIANANISDATKRAKELINFLGLSDREKHRPAELSGGEKQRVAVARALINNPKVIFADEPTGSLDSQNQEELQRLFFKIRDEFNHTFVIVTHDKHLANISDRQIEMLDGNIV